MEIGRRIVRVMFLSRGVVMGVSVYGRVVLDRNMDSLFVEVDRNREDVGIDIGMWVEVVREWIIFFDSFRFF